MVDDGCFPAPGPLRPCLPSIARRPGPWPLGSDPRALQVVAVAARELSRAREFAARHGVPRAYGSYEELAKDPNVGEWRGGGDAGSWPPCRKREAARAGGRAAIMDFDGQGLEIAPRSQPCAVRTRIKFLKKPRNLVRV